jgi:hypothetical protein
MSHGRLGREAKIPHPASVDNADLEGKKIMFHGTTAALAAHDRGERGELLATNYRGRHGTGVSTPLKAGAGGMAFANC